MEKVSRWNRFNVILLSVGAVISAGIGVLWYMLRKTPHEQKIERIRYAIQQSFHSAQQSLCPLIQGKAKLITNQRIQIRICFIPKLEQKLKSNLSLTHNPFQPPFPKGLVIDSIDISPKYRILYNRCSFFKQHLFIATQEFQNQHTRLEEKDLQSILLVMEALNGVFFFNCGPNSGCFYKHRHIQILPQNTLKLPILAEILKAITLNNLTEIRSTNNSTNSQSIYLFKGFDFLHAIKLIPEQFSQDNISLYKQFKSAQYSLYTYFITGQHLHPTKQKQLTHEQLSYNLIGCNKFLMFIPRDKLYAMGEIQISGLNFMGLVMVENIKLYDLMEKPGEIFKEVTFQLQNK